MIHIHVEWPKAPTFIKEMNSDIQSADFLYGGSYVLSYLFLASVLWLLFF